MGVDTECDLAVEAAGEPRVQAGVVQIRNRLLAEHLGLSVEAVADGIERAGSLRAFVDTRESAERTLVRIEVPPEGETAPSEALRAAADPDEPILSGSLVADEVPPVDATTRHGPLRARIGMAIALTVALIALSAALIERPEFNAVQSALGPTPSTSSAFWIGMAGFLLANLALIPLELMAIAAGMLFGALRGSGVALLGALVAAAAGYAAGRAIGRVGLSRWMSRRAYRSARQLGAQGVGGVVVLRLASAASAGSIHLLCGAVRVPFSTYIAGTVVGLAPATFAFAALGGLLRQTLFEPSLSNALLTALTAVLLVAVAALVRTLLLLRRFAPSVASHRARAEFG
jgi:uncharacterized membrane protein YdjX (TVP38/TMEM64 family)